MWRDGEGGERLKDEDVDDAVERAQLRQQYDPDHDKFGVKYQKPEKCS